MMTSQSIFNSQWFRSVAFAVAVLFTAMVLAAAQPETGKQAVVQVKGLSCPVCVHRLEKVLTKLPGATKAAVSLEESQAMIDFHSNAHFDNRQIAQAIRDAGFVPGKIEWHGAQSPNDKR